MKRVLSLLIVLALTGCISPTLKASDSAAQSTSIQVKPVKKIDSTKWPILKRYDQEHIVRIALPLGGIGTGTVSLGGRGNLQDWEIMNRPTKGFTPLIGEEPFIGPFIALYVKRSTS